MPNDSGLRTLHVPGEDPLGSGSGAAAPPMPSLGIRVQSSEVLVAKVNPRRGTGQAVVRALAVLVAVLAVASIGLTCVQPAHFRLGGRRYVSIGRTIADGWPPPGFHTTKEEFPYSRIWAFRAGNWCYTVIVADDYGD